MLAAAAAFALPLSAQTCCNDGYYISGFGGANFVPNFKKNVRESGETLGHVNADFDTGYFAGAALGYKLCSFRLETEFSYRNNDARIHQRAHSSSSSSCSSSSSGTQVAQAAAAAVVAESESSSSSSSDLFKLRGHLETYAVLANFYYDLDFCNCWNLKPYIGAGVGYAHNVTKAKVRFPGESRHRSEDDKSDKFAWQIIAGVAMPVTDCIDLALEYRYFNSGIRKIHNHDAGAALRFWF